MSHYKYLLDAGHGGIDKNGHYTTAPAKMFTHPEFVICEGDINRKIAKLVHLGLEQRGIDFGLVYDDVIDTPLAKRVEIADKVYEKDKRCIYISIHSNAGGGSGFEIFTSPGQTKSDKVANIFCELYKKHFPNFPFRSDKSDSDDDKEESFYVLRKTDCPAILIENLFFDNEREAKYLLSEEGQKAIADCIIECIETVERLKPI